MANTVVDDSEKRQASANDLSIDELYADPEYRRLRLANAERVKLLGRDRITGAQRWHLHDRTEVRYPDGSVDVIPD